MKIAMITWTGEKLKTVMTKIDNNQVINTRDKEISAESRIESSWEVVAVIEIKNKNKISIVKASLFENTHPRLVWTIEKTWVDSSL